ncbi:MAG: exodeoxyribonuclease VII large subunit [Patescibacteria group bacterium]|nr:exodeoxyribonuclease VII large subunit [Patescibacteria group bacterium]
MAPDANDLSLGVTEFVTLLNQTFDFAYPSLLITGELANLRISKNKWVYFDLKDESSSVKFFGTVYQLPGPLEDGMLLKVRGAPRLHNLYGFSVTVQSMQPAGEGTIKRAAELLQAKLQTEGLFDTSRKRALPYPPQTVGLITSGQSAAYADFVKIINARWSGLTISHIDVQVQGEAAPLQIVSAIEQCNALAEPPEVLVLIRGGGSAEDLAAFSTEQVTRAVAASRIPTLVAIGHEIDLSLAELAADQRASTPSNAAELLVPDRRTVLSQLAVARQQLSHQSNQLLQQAHQDLVVVTASLQALALQKVAQQRQHVQAAQQLLAAFNPVFILQRGYAIVRQNGHVIRSTAAYDRRQPTSLTMQDGTIEISN